MGVSIPWDAMPSLESGQVLQTAVLGLMGLADISSQNKLAEVAGVSANTLSGWFTGKVGPTIDTLGRIADPLGVPPWALLDVYRGRMTIQKLMQMRVLSTDVLDEIESRVRRAFREELRAVLDELRDIGQGPEGAP